MWKKKNKEGGQGARGIKEEGLFGGVWGMKARGGRGKEQLLAGRDGADSPSCLASLCRGA